MINFFKKRIEIFKNLLETLDRVKEIETSVDKLIMVVNQQQNVVLNLSRLNLETTYRLVEIENIVYNAVNQNANVSDDITIFSFEDDDFIN